MTGMRRNIQVGVSVVAHMWAAGGTSAARGSGSSDDARCCSRSTRQRRPVPSAMSAAHYTLPLCCANTPSRTTPHSLSPSSPPGGPRRGRRAQPSPHARCECAASSSSLARTHARTHARPAIERDSPTTPRLSEQRAIAQLVVLRARGSIQRQLQQGSSHALVE
jgi:hypothetical protein